MHNTNKQPLGVDEINIMDQAYYLPVFGPRLPLVITAGQGVYLSDQNGRRYLDLIGGIAVNVLGHNHPRLTAAICEQAGLVIHCSNYYYNEPQTRLAEKLSLKSTLPQARVFFGNSGAEANEAALKLARAHFYYRHEPRSRVISALKSFHGRTLATAAATGQSQYSRQFSPLPPDFIHLPYNDERFIKAIDSQTCAVMLELIQGESGVIPASLDFVKAVADKCRQTGALLIVDEIQTGIGRTGRFLACEQYDLKPDIITLAKGLAGGVPIGAMIAAGHLADSLHQGDHGSTFGGNPLACRAALTVLDELDEDLLNQVAQNGLFLRQAIQDLATQNDLVSTVRGSGLMIGIELSRPLAVSLKLSLLEKGCLVGSVGEQIIRLLPPLIIEKKHCILFIDILKQALEELNETSA